MRLDQIALRGLRGYGYHGVLDSERHDGQEFGVDAVLWVDTAAAAASDDLSLTVDYAAMAGRLASADITVPTCRSTSLSSLR